MSSLWNLKQPEHKEIFEGLLEGYLKRKDLDQLEPLRKAQAEEASGKGAQANMLAKLMSSAMSGGGGVGTPGQGGSNASREMLKALGFLKETPSEQQGREISTHLSNKQSDEAVKMEGEAEAIANRHGLYGELKKIIKDNPSSTGVRAGIGKMFGLNLTKGSAAFQEKQAKAQAELARLFSSRGGVQAAKLAAQGKPSVWNQPGYNMEMIDSERESSMRELAEMNDRYKQITGKNLPSYENIMRKQESEMPEQAPQQPQPDMGGQAPGGNYSPEQLAQQSQQTGDMAQVTNPQAMGKPDDMVHLVDPRTGKKVKMKRSFAEAIVSGKLKYAK